MGKIGLFYISIRYPLSVRRVTVFETPPCGLVIPSVRISFGWLIISVEGMSCKGITVLMTPTRCY